MCTILPPNWIRLSRLATLGWEALSAPSLRRLALITVALLGTAVMRCAQGAESKTPPATVHSPAAVVQADEGQPLFDGKTLKGWKITDFAGHGEVKVDPKFQGKPAIILDEGAILTGITFTNDPPKGDYEVSYDAVKLDGSDFFCALTFPAAGDHCTFVVGGWGGGVVGISSVDSMDASENETTKFLNFEKDRWYHFRVRVTKTKIEAWIDKDKVVDLVTTDRHISMRAGEIELAEPLGISAYQTKAALRNIRLRSL
jgi:hypothetical protein